MSKHILLVCFDFPPNYGIGGRRWAKFAKQLAKNGHILHVIKSDSFNESESAWISDVQSDFIHIHSIPSNYPKYVNEKTKFFLTKIIRRIRLWFLYKKEKGTIYDKALKWENLLLKKSRELISHNNIKNIIATGAPFNIGYYLSKLKKENPKLNLIFDYRDPWITAQNYGMKELSNTKKTYEKYKQNQLIEAADFITAPNKYLLKEIRESSNYVKSIHDSKFIILQHFYDPSDLKSMKANVINDNKIRLVYGGTLYSGVEEYLLKIVHFLNNLKEKNKGLYKRLEFNFYTPEIRFEEIFIKHKSICNFYEPIGKEIFSQINKSDYVMIFLGNHNKDFMTTKFYEFLTFKKPYIYFGPLGEVSNEIEKNNLGRAEFDISIEFEQILEKGIKNYNLNYPLEKNSLSNITEKLELLFKKNQLE